MSERMTGLLSRRVDRWKGAKTSTVRALRGRLSGPGSRDPLLRWGVLAVEEPALHRFGVKELPAGHARTTVAVCEDGQKSSHQGAEEVDPHIGERAPDHGG